MIKFIRDAFVIARKDIRLELKTKEILSSMLVFSMLVVVVFSFIFEPGKHETTMIAGGVYLMALVFAGLLGLSRSMQTEITGGNLEALLLSPIGRNSLFFGKVISNMTFMIAMQLIMVPLFLVLYDINMMSTVYAAIVLFCTTYGFVLLGTLFSLMAARSKTREILLPVLLLPILIPVILAAIQSLNASIAMMDISEYSHWVKLIVVYDIIFTALAIAMFEPVVEA